MSLKFSLVTLVQVETWFVHECVRARRADSNTCCRLNPDESHDHSDTECLLFFVLITSTILHLQLRSYVVCISITGLYLFLVLPKIERNLNAKTSEMPLLAAQKFLLNILCLIWLCTAHTMKYFIESIQHPRIFIWHTSDINHSLDAHFPSYVRLYVCACVCFFTFLCAFAQAIFTI